MHSPAPTRASSLDDLLGPHEHRGRDGEAEGLGGPQIDHDLELRRLLDGQVGGFRAPEDLVHEGRGATRDLGHRGSIGNERTRIREHAVAPSNDQTVSSGKLRNTRSLRPNQALGCEEERIDLLPLVTSCFPLDKALEAIQQAGKLLDVKVMVKQ